MVIYLPPGDHGQKVGLDDYLASGHTTQELLALASAELLSPADDHQDAITPYQETERGLVFMKSTRDGTVSVPLTNFNAKIVSHLIEDDGVESRGLLEIEASLNEKRMRCMVSPARFNAMTWPLEQIGPEAVVYSGFGAKDHARVAIQVLSGLVTKRRVYTHTGWRERDGEWVYLHGGGAIGSIGTILGVEVQLPAALAGVVLPEPPARDKRVAVIRSSLNFLGLAPMRVTIPMYMAIARSLLPDVDFSVNLVGATGTGKTALAALVQQHFGTAIGARRLPAAWSSTPNALEDLAFQAKDMVLTIDDFIPTGSNGDVQRMHAVAGSATARDREVLNQSAVAVDRLDPARFPPRHRLQPTVTIPLSTRTTVDGSGTAKSYRMKDSRPEGTECAMPLPTIATVVVGRNNWPIIVNGASPATPSEIPGLVNVRTPPQPGVS
jgi:hypothetical protein